MNNHPPKCKSAEELLQELKDMLESEKVTNLLQKHLISEETITNSNDILSNSEIGAISSSYESQLHNLSDMFIKPYSSDAVFFDQYISEEAAQLSSSFEKKVIFHHISAKEIQTYASDSQEDTDSEHSNQPGPIKANFTEIIENGTKRWQCTFPDCSKKFTRRSGTNARSHWLTHMDVKPYICEVCNKSFTRKLDCKRHSKSHIEHKTK